MPHGIPDLAWRCTPRSVQEELIRLRAALTRIRDYADADPTTQAEVNIAAWADKALGKEK